MDTKTKLQENLKDAMRANDEVQKRTIRMALTAMRLAEVEKMGPLDEPGQIAIIQKEIKGRHESIADAQRANRPDLIPDNEAEIKVLETYLPAQLSDEALQAMVQDAIAEVGAKTPADMGKVMKVILPRVKGVATSDKVSQMVKQALAAA
jgi:uncharacterized protein